MAFEAPAGFDEVKSDRIEFEFWNPAQGGHITGVYVAKVPITQENRQTKERESRDVFVIAVGDGDETENYGLSGADVSERFKNIKLQSSVFVQFLGTKGLSGGRSPMKLYGVAVGKRK